MSALVAEIVDNNENSLDASWDIKTFSEGGKIYALVTSQGVKPFGSDGNSTHHQPFVFNPSGNSLQEVKNATFWGGRITSGLAIESIGDKRYVAVVSTDEDRGHTESQPSLAIFDYTDPSNPSGYLENLTEIFIK